MSSHQEIAEKAIAERLKTLQAEVDKQRQDVVARAKIIDEARTWTSIPADISDDTIVALFIHLNTDPNAPMEFGDKFVKDLQKFLEDLANADRSRIINISRMAQEAMAQGSPHEPGELLLEAVIQKPDQPGGEWTIAVVPMVLDQDYKVSVASGLPYNVQLSAYVSPRSTGASLREEFNVAAVFTPAGDTHKPYVFAYKPDSQGLKNLHIVGHIEFRGQVQPLNNVINFVVGNPQRKIGFDAHNP